MAISQKENLILKESKVCIVGCGGLGGHIIEMLGRLGVGNITVIDGDVFDESNLNRQILSDENNIGKSKALAAQTRMNNVNSQIKIIPIAEYLNEDNGEELLRGHELVVDALDNIPSRLIVEKTCGKLNIPFVHGAIAGWYGQVSTVFPGDNTLSKIYRDNRTDGVEKRLGNPSFIPGLISSIQVAEVVKLLIDRGDLLRNKLLFIDLLEQEYNIIDLT